MPSPLLPRRTLLRAAGLSLGLPLLESMSGGRARAGEPARPRRMVCIQTNMGILPQYFFPATPGADYAPTPYLERLAAHRDRLTVFSGLSHPRVTGGHAAERCFLTGTPHPERGGFRNGISLDQFAAERVGDQTRHASLALAVSNEGSTLSYTRNGAPIPSESSPRKLFQRLFLLGKAEEVEANVEALRQGRSLLDFVAGQSRRLERDLPGADRRRLDQYLTSVRELERRLQTAQEWERKPKPVVGAKPPDDIEDAREFARRSRLMFDMITLALETDSTRVVSLFIDTTVIHNITHHGNRPEVLADLQAKESSQFDALAAFLTALRAAPEEGETLLDRTMVLYGTPMGSANSHSNVNLPVLLAGGPFKHGRHLAFNPENNAPLANVFLAMLHRMGIEVDAFSSSRGTPTGLEPT